MSYTKTTWVNGSSPAINATNLNKMEQGIKDAVDGVESIRYHIKWSDFSTVAEVNAEIQKAVALKKATTDRVTVVFYGTMPDAIKNNLINLSFASNMNYENQNETDYGYQANSPFYFELSNVTFKNFYFQNGSSTAPCVSLYNCQNIEFIDCTFKAQIVWAVDMQKCHHLYFENCSFNANSMPVTGHTACVEISDVQSGWIMFQSCRFNKVRGKALYCNTTDTNGTTFVTGCLVAPSGEDGGSPFASTDVEKASGNQSSVYVSAVEGQGGGGGASYFGYTLSFNNQTGGSINCGVLGTYNGNYGWHTIDLDDGFGTIDGEDDNSPTITNATLMYINSISFRDFGGGSLKLLDGTVVNSKSAFESHTKTFYVVYTDTEIGWMD